VRWSVCEGSTKKEEEIAAAKAQYVVAWRTRMDHLRGIWVKEDDVSQPEE
jgi:hypothetical protein